MTLDTSQQRAVSSTDQNILVCAGPGSGKTRVVVHRILRLISEGVDPSEIVAITYTNAAADEMKARIKSASNDGVHIGFCGTLHAFILSLIQSHYHVLGFRGRVTVIDAEVQKSTLESVSKDLKYTGSKKELADIIRSGIPVLPPAPTRAQLAAKSYYDFLIRTGTIDMDSILVFGEELLSRMPQIAIRMGNHAAQHLFVDEFQDCSDRDFRILSELPIVNRCFVGDPDQGIYGFRFGSVSHILKLSKDPAWTVILLENNYRSVPQVTSAAQSLIEHNVGRITKQTIPTSTFSGVLKRPVPFDDPGRERAWIMQFISNLRSAQPPVLECEIAILLRTNPLVNDMADYMRQSGIPVKERRKRNIPEDWPKVRLCIGLLDNPSNDHLAHRFLMEQKGKSAADKIELEAAQNFTSINDYHLHVSRQNMYGIMREIGVSSPTLSIAINAAESLGSMPDSEFFNQLSIKLHEEIFTETVGEGITVCTMHAAKGLEWRVVLLPAFEDELIPGEHSDTDMEEERRLAYVAITRAKECLVITSSKVRKHEWKGETLFPHKPSRFLTEMVSEDSKISVSK